MSDYISDEEIRQAVAALEYIRQYGSEYRLEQFLQVAKNERHQQKQIDGWQRQIRAGFVASDLATMTKLPMARCESAANEVIVGSYARCVIDEIRRYARELWGEQNKKPVRRRRVRGAA